MTPSLRKPPRPPSCFERHWQLFQCFTINKGIDSFVSGHKFYDYDIFFDPENGTHAVWCGKCPFQLLLCWRGSVLQCIKNTNYRTNFTVGRTFYSQTSLAKDLHASIFHHKHFFMMQSSVIEDAIP